MIWLFLLACSTSEPVRTHSATHTPTVSAVDPVLGRLRAKPLAYTRHARCRMDCRHIREDEVDEILRVGKVAPDRTRHDGECTSYAVEGVTSDEQEVRIVYADCASETRVVTAIDLGEDWPCTCD
ncbi:MAG: DUF4258 domain-containing protein [Deltaproteobacteria bacterium]|nr:MAG: DUF4258 domain-containing protein [Deltaproteobacteria bacterium]